MEIHPDAPAKPALGAPCNGCGVCCLLEPCPVGILLSRRTRGACRAVRWQPGQARYVCGVLADAPPGWRRRLLTRWIAAGQGCDASLSVSAVAGAPRPS